MAYVSSKNLRRVRHDYRTTVDHVPVGTPSFGALPFTAIAAGAQAAGMIKPKVAKAAGAVAGAASGAKVGSAFGPIGTGVGAVIGAGISLLGGKKVAKAELYWNDWRKSAMGKVSGSQLDNMSFEEAFKGMWDTNNKDFPGYARYRNSREQFKADMAQQIVNAAVAGKLDNSDTAGSVYTKIVKPWLETMKPGGIPGKRTDIIQLMVDLIDRYLHDLPISRADMPEYKSQGYAPSIPILSEGLAKTFPSILTTVKTPPPVSAPPIIAPAPTAPVTPVVPMPATPIPQVAVTPITLPANATTTDLTKIVDELTAKYQAAIAGANLNAEQVRSQTLDFVNRTLQASGVQQTPQAQEVTKAIVEKSVIPNWVLPVAIGAGVLLLTTLRGRRTR